MDTKQDDKLISEIINSVEAKEEMIDNHPSHYLMKASISGLIILLGYLAYFTIATNFEKVAGLDVHAVGKFMAAAFFPLCLTMIYYTKSELLTSNMMMVSVSRFFKQIDTKRLLKILATCIVGNLIGGLIYGLIVAPTSIIDPIYETMASAVEVKQNYIANGAYLDCFLRAILCGVCINLPMIAIYQAKNMDGITKFILMFFGVFIFAYLGFEHSVANSVLFEMVFLYEKIHSIVEPIVNMNAVYNVVLVILGNMIGGLIIGLIYSTIYNYHKVEISD